MLGKHSTTELPPEPLPSFLYFSVFLGLCYYNVSAYSVGGIVLLFEDLTE
jgi:hypothetical protein